MAVDQVSRNNTMIKVPTDSVMSLSKGQVSNKLFIIFQNEIVSRIEDKIALWTLLPKGEGHVEYEVISYPTTEVHGDEGFTGIFVSYFLTSFV
ncbi:hypothetical protein QJS10_CPA06g01513 [Acorus calamus]|uniref:Uncharacterized protein n=1 Tax=Acorus calamus TaxID=4465 RepID=A0AAV9ET78_ACOCL|nr:hypothetical protein QJS10_CPA06g01513 [Acorus calamus]